MDNPLKPPPPDRRTFFQRAATFCLWAPFIGILLNVFCWGPGRAAARRSQVAMDAYQASIDAAADAFLAGFVPLLGLIAGIVALFGIRRYGTGGILWKAVTGILITLLLVGAAIPNLLKARELSRQRHEQRYGHPPP